MNESQRLEAVRVRVAGVRYLLGAIAENSNREEAEAIAVLGYELDEAYSLLMELIEKKGADDDR